MAPPKRKHPISGCFRFGNTTPPSDPAPPALRAERNPVRIRRPEVGKLACQAEGARILPLAANSGDPVRGGVFALEASPFIGPGSARALRGAESGPHPPPGDRQARLPGEGRADIRPTGEIPVPRLLLPYPQASLLPRAVESRLRVARRLVPSNGFFGHDHFAKNAPPGRFLFANIGPGSARACAERNPVRIRRPKIGKLACQAKGVRIFAQRAKFRFLSVTSSPSANTTPPHTVESRLTVRFISLPRSLASVA